MKKFVLFSLAFLLIAVFLWIMYNKNISLHNWLYGSDLGNYDTMLQETLKGNFGVEYNYGIAFGDHSSFSMLLFLPVKLFLGAKTMDFLIAVTPVCYLLCGLFILYFFYKKDTPWLIVIMAMSGFIFHLNFLKGNYEENYGFHIDTASGYILTIIAFLLSLNSTLNRKYFILLVFLYLWFLLLKEEMALLGVIFFGSLWLVTKEKKYMVWLLVTLAIFLILIASIHYFKTPFNRGNTIFITTLIKNINKIGFWSFLAKVPMNTFWNFILFYGINYGALAYFNRFSPLAFALFITAMVKSAICFVTGDYFFDSWHGFPAMAMFAGAVILQAIEKPGKNKYRINPSLIVPCIFAAITLISIKTDYSYSIPIKGCANSNRIYKAQAMGYLEEMKKLIPQNKLVALNEYITVEFADGYRYSLFPRGTWLIPAGIADYILLNREINGMSFMGLHKAKEMDANVAKEFKLIAENQGFSLYKRIKPSASQDKLEFIKHCGMKTLN